VFLRTFVSVVSLWRLCGFGLCAPSLEGQNPPDTGSAGCQRGARGFGEVVFAESRVRAQGEGETSGSGEFRIEDCCRAYRNGHGERIVERRRRKCGRQHGT
jgi:hypothetical protein